MTEVRKLEPEDSFMITGRGRVYSAKEPDPPYELRESVEFDGRVRKIIGLERHPIAGSPIPGKYVGVQLESYDD